MDIATASPAEIDAELARIGSEIAVQHDILERAKRAISQYQQYRDTADPIVIAATAKARARIDTAADRVVWLRMQAAPHEAEFTRRGGWTRYYLVDSETGTGHVHYDVSHSRCSRRPSTRHYWLTSESGKPPAEVIALAGDRVCTICFPDAPAVGPCSYRTPSEEEKARRVAAKAAKRAEKNITNPDGTLLRINLNGYWETIHSVAAAWRTLIDIPFEARAFGDRHTNDREVAACQVIIKALAAKLGQPEDTIKTDAEVRLIKKCRREGITYVAD